MWTIFRYCYRDAGNFKAFGSVAVEGALTIADRAVLESRLEPDRLFVVEQVGLPPLYEELYRWSGGPVAADHCWHEMVDLLTVSERPEQVPVWGTAAGLVARFRSVETWNGALSPHFEL